MQSQLSSACQISLVASGADKYHEASKRMGTTTDLRRALKTDFFPLLLERGFVIDQRHAPHFIDFRRMVGNEVQFIEFMWDKYGRARFNVSSGVVSKLGTVAMAKPGQEFHTAVEDIGPGQAPRYIRLFPNAVPRMESTRDWFRQDVALWKRMLGMSSQRPVDHVIADLKAVFVEIEEYLSSGKVGIHCRETVNPPFKNVIEQ
jgi:hypothetical protein